MAIPISNVNSTTDTFLDWLDKTNQVLDNLSTKIITTEANTSGGVTTGNAYVNGTVSANVVAVVHTLRGGSIASPNTLIVVSNTRFTNATADIFAITSNTSTTKIVANTVEATFNNTNTNIISSLLNINSNVNIQSSNVNIVSAKTNMQGNVEIANTLVIQNSLTAGNTTVLGFANIGDAAVIGGDLTVGGNSFVVDVDTNRVAINSDNTSNNLLTFFVNGNTAISANLYVQNRIEAVSIKAVNLEVDGTLFFSGTANGSLIPAANTLSLGNTTSTWILYASSGSFTDNINVQNSGSFANQITVGSNVVTNTTSVRIGNTTVNAVVTSSSIAVSNATSNVTINAGGIAAPLFSGNGASLTSVNAATVGGNTASDLRNYASDRASNAYGNAISFSSNATNISSGTLDTARLPTTANIATAINIGANVNLTTAQISINGSATNLQLTNNQVQVGNSTVNTSINPAVINIGANVAANTSALRIGNSSVNTIITSTSIVTGSLTTNTFSATTLSGNGANITSVNAATVGGNTAATLRSYSDSAAATAYSNAVSTAAADATSKAATAYSNAVSVAAADATSKAGTAYSNAIAFASNGSNISSGTIADARIASTLVRTSRAINNGTGITGGGDLSANRTIGLTGQALAFHNLATNGIVVRTGAGTVAGRSIVAGNNIVISNGDGVAGNITIAATVPQAIGITATPQFAALGINTAAGATGTITAMGGIQGGALGIGTAAGDAGTIRATSDIIAHYSDERLKDIISVIPNALEKVNTLDGFYFRENNTAKLLGYTNDEQQVGVSAQKVQAIMPEVVKPAPINSEYLTVQYEKLVPLLIEAIKELDKKVKDLTEKLENNGTKS